MTNIAAEVAAEVAVIRTRQQELRAMSAEELSRELNRAAMNIGGYDRLWLIALLFVASDQIDPDNYTRRPND